MVAYGPVTHADDHAPLAADPDSLATSLASSEGYRGMAGSRHHMKVGLATAVVTIAGPAVIVRWMPAIGGAGWPIAASVSLAVGGAATCLGWALGRTSLGFHPVALPAPLLLVVGMIATAGGHPASSATFALASAGMAAALLVGVVRLPLGILVMSATCGVLWGATTAAGGEPVQLVGMDYPHPPLWVLFPVSAASYTALLVNWLALLWSALAGAMVGAFHLGRSTRSAVTLAAPASALAVSVALPTIAAALLGSAALIAAGRWLLLLDDAE